MLANAAKLNLKPRTGGCKPADAHGQYARNDLISCASPAMHQPLLASLQLSSCQSSSGIPTQAHDGLSAQADPYTSPCVAVQHHIAPLTPSSLIPHPRLGDFLARGLRSLLSLNDCVSHFSLMIGNYNSPNDLFHNEYAAQMSICSRCACSVFEDPSDSHTLMSRSQRERRFHTSVQHAAIRCQWADFLSGMG